MTGAESAIWRFAVPALRWCSRHLQRPVVTGVGHVPAGGAVLAYNHERLTDWLFAIQATDRPMRFLVGDHVMRWPLVGRVLRAAGQISIERGASDSEGIRRAIAAAGAGELVGVFPEGRLVRGEGLGAIQRGAALIATRAGVPLVPVAILRGPVRVRIGAPLEPAGSTRELTARLEIALRSLVES